MVAASRCLPRARTAPHHAQRTSWRATATACLETLSTCSFVQGAQPAAKGKATSVQSCSCPAIALCWLRRAEATLKASPLQSVPVPWRLCGRCTACRPLMTTCVPWAWPCLKMASQKMQRWQRRSCTETWWVPSRGWTWSTAWPRSCCLSLTVTHSRVKEQLPPTKPAQEIKETLRQEQGLSVLLAHQPLSRGVQQQLLLMLLGTAPCSCMVLSCSARPCQRHISWDLWASPSMTMLGITLIQRGIAQARA
mmetsp:Transcript_28766/g.74196  ORF Transcript_28766/g.74196 Transcript_28766/m.74196 type:complete len:251 (+) Transcript_28766:2186-2938(+)